MVPDDLRKRGNYYLSLADELEKEPTSFDDLVFKLYIKYEKLKPVSEHLKSCGKKTADGGLFQPDDVSAIIKNKKASVNVLIQKLAMSIFKNNSKGVDRMYS